MDGGCRMYAPITEPDLHGYDRILSHDGPSSYAPPSEYAQIRPRGEEEGLISGSDKGWKGEMIYDISYPSICNVQLGSFKSKV